MFGGFTNKISQFLLNKAKNKKNEELNDFIKDLLKELNDILLNEDVHPTLIQLIIKDSEKFLNDNKNQLLDSKNLIKNLIKNILSQYITEESNFPWKKNIILIGDNGNGKTTVASKLAYYWAQQGLKIAIIHHDPFRFGSRKQLEDNLMGTGINILSINDNTHDYDRVIIDTAGFYSWDENYKNTINFTGNYIYVGSCLTGNNAYHTIENIIQNVNIDGIIITNCDGEARSGLFLSASYLMKTPILFITDNESIKGDDYNQSIIEFNKDNLLKRLVGLYDETGFQDAIDKVSKSHGKLMNKFLTGIFDYETMEEILEGIVYNKFNSLLGSLGNMAPQDPQQKVMMKKMLLVIQSMTLKERRNMDLLKGPTRISRLQRIGKGTNLDIPLVDILIQNIDNMIKTFKNFSTNGLSQLENLDNIDDIKDKLTDPEFLQKYINSDDNEENIIKNENNNYNNNMSVTDDNNDLDNKNNINAFDKNMPNPFGNKDMIKQLKTLFPNPQDLLNFIKGLSPDLIKRMPGMENQDVSILQSLTLEHIQLLYNMDN